MGKNLRLSELVEIAINNMDCVVLKVKENKFMELIALGCFDGNEQMFRLTKGEEHTCTVWTKDGHSYDWHWGRSGHTLVSDKLSQQGRLIQECIREDFHIVLEGCWSNIASTLYTALPEHETLYLKLTWWPNHPSDLNVSRNGDFWKKYEGYYEYFIADLEEAGYEVEVKGEIETASTGCKVLHLTAIK